MKQLKAKGIGSLLGVAIGDALGATVEFMTPKEIQEKYGVFKDIIGQGYWQLSPGEVTDDTDMTMALAKGIIAEPQAPIEAIARFFADWARTKPKDIGNICRLALSEGMKRAAASETEWLETAKYAHDQSGGRSGGNGSLMRTIPVVLAYWQDPAKMLQIASRQSALTHYDPVAGQCVMFYCDLVRTILQGKDLKTAIEEASGEKNREIFLNKDLLLKIDLSPKEIKTTGYVVHTLEAALNCAYQTESFEEALIMAVNLGGDTDTIGAVTGGIAGAYYGMEAIPERWLNTLRVKDEMIHLAEQLFT
jgi:ADP-ribosyl-[dinitrogen reductase] hydrolase